MYVLYDTYHRLSTKTLNICMIFYTALDIEPEPLTPVGVAFMNYNKAVNRHFRILLDVPKYIRPELVELLDQAGLHIRFAELFYTPADLATLIHIDGDPDEYTVSNNMAKLNYVGNGSGSMMHWYKPVVNKHYEPTGKNKFISFEPNEVKLIKSVALSGYNIIQTGIPHNITTTSESRYCVSLTLALKDEKPKMLPYELLFAKLLSNKLKR